MPLEILLPSRRSRQALSHEEIYGISISNQRMRMLDNDAADVLRLIHGTKVRPGLAKICGFKLVNIWHLLEGACRPPRSRLAEEDALFPLDIPGDDSANTSTPLACRAWIYQSPGPCSV